MNTIGGALRRATARLKLHSDSAEHDARLLLAHLLDVSTSRLYSNPEAHVDAADMEQLERLITRRAAGEPVAYITGHCGFWTLDLAVNPAVLIPRPDTETLVETALATLPATACDIVDLGTGSGAIALSLASERRQWRVSATDASLQALDCARTNAAALVPGRVTFFHGHWFDPLDVMRFDAVISNPPYVAADDEHLRAPELGHEPITALVAHNNGLADLAYIANHASDHLNPGGWLLLEHGFDQGDAVRELLEDAGFRDVRTQPDLAGRARVTLGQNNIAASPG